MAKTTKAGGASFTQHEMSDPNPPVVVRRAMLGGEPKLAGTDSSELSLKELPSSELGTHNPQEHALTTENHSSPTEVDQEVSSATSTGGNGRRGTRTQSGKRKVNTRSIASDDSDFSEFE